MSNNIDSTLEKMYGPQRFMRERPNGWFEIGYKKPTGGLEITGRGKSYEEALKRLQDSLPKPAAKPKAFHPKKKWRP